MSPHLKFLHMTRKFSTDNVRGVRDKYQVCTWHTHAFTSLDILLSFAPNHLGENNTDFLMNLFGDFFGLPYNYKSVMHYDQYQQSKNGQITIQTLDPNLQEVSPSWFFVTLKSNNFTIFLHKMMPDIYILTSAKSNIVGRNLQIIVLMMGLNGRAIETVLKRKFTFTLNWSKWHFYVHSWKTQNFKDDFSL